MQTTRTAIALLTVPCLLLGATSPTKQDLRKSMLKAIYTLEEAFKQEHETYEKSLDKIGFDTSAGRLNHLSISITAASKTKFKAKACDSMANCLYVDHTGNIYGQSGVPHSFLYLDSSGLYIQGKFSAPLKLSDEGLDFPASYWEGFSLRPVAEKMRKFSRGEMPMLRTNADLPFFVYKEILRPVFSSRDSIIIIDRAPHLLTHYKNSPREFTVMLSLNAVSVTSNALRGNDDESQGQEIFSQKFTNLDEYSHVLHSLRESLTIALSGNRGKKYSIYVDPHPKASMGDVLQLWDTVSTLSKNANMTLGGVFVP